GATAFAGLNRHPERSRPKGGVVEGPALVAGRTEKVPPLRLAALGSGRDDGLSRIVDTLLTKKCRNPPPTTKLPGAESLQVRSGPVYGCTSSFGACHEPSPAHPAPVRPVLRSGCHRGSRVGPATRQSGPSPPQGPGQAEGPGPPAGQGPPAGPGPTQAARRARCPGQAAGAGCSAGP